MLAVLRQRPLGVLTATLHGQGAGAVGPGFARAVENGLMAERSWLASPLVNAGPAKAAQSIELALKVEVQPVANTMTGPDGRDAAQRVTARVELKSPAQPAATVAAFEVDAEFTEADAVMLTAADPASAQQAVLGQKLGRSIARALGIGRSAAVR